MAKHTEIYRVKSGESLSIIARDLLNDIERWPEIAFLNGIRHPYFIYPGQVLELPPEKGSNIVEIVSTIIPNTDTPATAGLSYRPATVFLIVVGVVLFLNWSK